MSKNQKIRFDSKVVINGLLNTILIALVIPVQGLLTVIMGSVLRIFIPLTDSFNLFLLLIQILPGLVFVVFAIRYITKKRIKNEAAAIWTLLPIAVVALFSCLAWFVLSSQDDMAAVLPASFAFLMTVYLVTVFIFTGKFFIKTKNPKKA